MKIEIFTETDNHDCETCGGSFAEGGRVLIDGKEVINEPPTAYCYGGISYSEDELLVMALKKIGINVYVDDILYHVTCYNDDCHGKME